MQIPSPLTFDDIGLEFGTEGGVQDGIACTAKDTKVSNIGLAATEQSIGRLVTWSRLVWRAIPHVVGSFHSQGLELLSEIGSQKHGCRFLP